MLFRHGESSAYGYPEDATEPYALEFVALKVDPVFFDAIRSVVGSCVPMLAHAESTTALHSLMQHYERRNFRDRFHESLCVYELLMALLREVSRGDPLRDPVATAHDYILNHYQQPVSQKEVANRVGLSREHLARAFKRRYNTSPAEFCRKLRLQRARELLSQPFAPITEVALHCGYSDPCSFARAFRQAEGISPQAYKCAYK
jgi:AraC-like DNA-binding protein